MYGISEKYVYCRVFIATPEGKKRNLWVHVGADKMYLK